MTKMSFFIVCFKKHSQPEIIGNIPIHFSPNSIYCPRCKINVNPRGPLKRDVKIGKTHGHFLVHPKSRNAMLIEEVIGQIALSPNAHIQSSIDNREISQAKSELDEPTSQVAELPRAKTNIHRYGKRFCSYPNDCPDKHISKMNGKNVLTYALQFCLLNGRCNQQVEDVRQARTQLTEVIA